MLIVHERKALRDRFFEAGPISLPDLEILEFILFWALPRQDVKPLAKELLEAFGDFTRVVKNPIDRSRQHTGLTKAVALEFQKKRGCGPSPCAIQNRAPSCAVFLGRIAGLLQYRYVTRRNGEI